MVHNILLSFSFVVLFGMCSCLIFNDINPKMLGTGDDDDDIEVAALMKQFAFVYPGTKWCGAGNVAANDDDLGKEREVDMCCRDHDHCPDLIPGGETKHNLTNTVFYTRLSCSCDEQFYTCLKAAGTRTAKSIGKIYFNALQTKCFREEYPVVSCVRRGGWFRTKCLQHSYDTNGEKTYQWFDVQDY